MIKVISHAMQRYAVWFGGSLIGASAEFSKNVKTKAGKLIFFSLKTSSQTIIYTFIKNTKSMDHQYVEIIQSLEACSRFQIIPSQTHMT